MNRTSKALARIGIGAVTTAAILATPLAIGTASAATGTLAANNPTPGTVTDNTTGAAHAAYPGEGQAQVTYTAGDGGAQTIVFTIAGSTTAYFTPTADQPAGVTTNNPTQATCVTAAASPVSCAVNVGDTAVESVNLNVTDQTDSAHLTTTTSVPFNGVHFADCSQTGINDPTNCTSQGTVNTVKTFTVHYGEGNSGQSGKNLIAVITGGNAQFTGSQPPGSQNLLVTEAQCTTDASGNCSFTIVDAVQETADVVVEALNPTPFPTAEAEQAINFQATSVAPAELDLDSSTVIAPNVQTAGQGQLYAEPGDVIQNQYTLRGATVPNGAGTPACAPIAPATVCPGVPLANTTLTLKVSNGFFTPNCVFPASTSPASLTNNIYASCSFNTTPAAGTAVGDLKSSGQSIDVKTDNQGRVVVSLGIGKDASFDDDGIVAAAVSDGSIVPQVGADQNLPSSSTCASNPSTVLAAVDGSSGLGGVPSGCDITNLWTTNEVPLNGATAKDVVVPAIKNPNDTFIGSENNYDATDTGTINVPDVDRVVFVVHLTDQFGNLTSNDGDSAGTEPTSDATAGIEKTGPGNLLYCTGFSQTDACSSGAAAPGATQPDGTVTQDLEAFGSYTNNTPAAQQRYEADAGDPGTGIVINNSDDAHSGTPGVNDGTQTDTTGWFPQTTTFTNYTAATTTSAAFAQFASGTATAPSVDTLTLNFYNQLAQPVITFSVKPGHKVPTGTGVTTQAKVLDQFNNPITDQLVQFVRTGSNESSCVPIQNGGGTVTTPVFTNAAGVAGYTFSCNAAGTSTVSIVVTGPGNTQLAQGKEAVKFTGQSLHLKKEKPKLGVHVSGHKVTLKIKTHPAVHGKTVHFYKLVHGLRHLVGAAKTSKSGTAKLHLHLHGGKYHFDAKVQGLKATKYNSKYSKTKTVKV